jgi:hypothetical protein
MRSVLVGRDAESYRSGARFVWRTPTLGIVFMLLFAQVGVARDPDNHGPSTAGPEDHNLDRAGQPQLLSRFAIPGIEKHEGPGYVGGGKLIHGDGRGPTDGTFAFDYQGLGWRPGRVFLGWAHDRAHQPQLGPYRTDTHHLPDPLSLHPVRRVFDENKGK